MTASDLARVVPPGTRLYARITRRSRTGGHADLLMLAIRTDDPEASIYNVSRAVAAATGASLNPTTGDLIIRLSGAGALTDLQRQLPGHFITEV